MAEERGAPVVPASKLRIEMEEDAEAEARSLASFAVEDSARFWEVTRRNARTPDLQALPPKKKCVTDGQASERERVRLRAREGEDVEWTRRIAQRAGTLKEMMDDAQTEDGVYPLPTIAATELAMLREMCEADSMPARLEQSSIPELFRLVEGANFLDAPGALNHAQRALASRLKGKRADELREVLGATDDFGSVEDRVAALAEPAFSPEGQLSGATTQSPSLSGVAVTDDAKKAALGMVDVGTLAELKGVNRWWLALARRVLCSRLSRCEGQPLPTELAEITDLNIKVLVDAGRPWEAAAAGRMLPSLARLRWEGFTVNVGAVRELDLAQPSLPLFPFLFPDDDDDIEERPAPPRPFLKGHTKSALLSCIEGEGEPPLQLLLAAVACAGSGEICGESEICGENVTLSWERSIPVQMMRDDLFSELDLAKRGIGVEGGMLLAHLVPVMVGLTSFNLSRNNLTHYGRDMTGITELAAALGLNVRLTALDLSFNYLKDEGISAVCKAIQSNKETKLASLDFGNNGIGPVGANAVAAMVAVTGVLTSLDVRSNNIAGDGAVQLSAAVLCNLKIEIFNKIPIKEMRANSLTKLDLKGKLCGVVGGMVVAGLLPVMGSLTSINLSGNSLTNYGRDMTGITELAAALRVNSALTNIS